MSETETLDPRVRVALVDMDIAETFLASERQPVEAYATMPIADVYRFMSAMRAYNDCWAAVQSIAHAVYGEGWRHPHVEAIGWRFLEGDSEAFSDFARWRAAMARVAHEGAPE